MARHVSVGIDIGTYQVKVVAGERTKKEGKLFKRIIGTGVAESKGLRYGYIININEVSQSVREAVAQAERTAGIRIRQAHISVGGVSLEGIIANGSVVISRADSEITDLDMARVAQASESALPQAVILNRKVIHTVPIQYKIDGKEVLGRPVGMKATKLDARTLFVTCLEQHLHDLIQAVEEAGIEVVEVVASPIAAGLVTLTKAQKIAGCVLANIGAETVSVCVYENDIPISLKVFPIGSKDITNDIALGLQIPLEEAEEVKVGGGRTAHPRKRLEEIVVARLTDIFELIESHLKKIGKNGLLPAGIVLTGGGSGIATIEDLAKASLQLPSQRATVSINAGNKGSMKDPSWTVAYGLCLVGLSQNNELEHLNPVKETRHNVVSWIKRFLP